MSQRHTIDQVCIACDHANELKTIYALWYGVVAHKYTYSIVELRFILEHLTEKAGRLGARDGKKVATVFKKFLEL